MPDSSLRQLGNDSVCDQLSGRCDVVKGDNEIVFGRTRRRDSRQKLRGHSRCHFAKFRPRFLLGQVN